MRLLYLCFTHLIILGFTYVSLPAQDIKKQVDQFADAVEEKVISWRRDFHQHPELSNREFETSAKIAAHLEELGMEVQTGIAHTGVVGILKGVKDKPVIGLRADIDALPVRERVDVPFASTVEAVYNEQKVGVMHACGHDTHIAILMGVAEVMTKLKDQIPGTIKFIFQPAEEGAPAGEEGGAKLMVEEGVLEDPAVDVIFGLHINSLTDVGQIKYKPGATLAAADKFTIKVKGKQTHGSSPWTGADPIVSSAMIINGLQTIISRQTELTKEAAVISVGSIHGGVRNNIIPEEVEMIGTIRTLDDEMQDIIHEKIEIVATNIAKSQGTTAEVHIQRGYPVTYNEPALTKQMLPSLQEAAGKENVILIPPITGAEDFSYYQRKVPGVFFFLGGKSLDVPVAEAAPHHTPDFYIDESGFKLGIRALSYLTLDYMNDAQSTTTE